MKNSLNKIEEKHKSVTNQNLPSSDEQDSQHNSYDQQDSHDDGNVPILKSTLVLLKQKVGIL